MASTTVVEDTSNSEDEQISIYDDSSDGEFQNHSEKVPESGDSQCIFCDGKFSDDVQGETWIQCTRCDLWCHADCADYEYGTYVCDFCK